MSLGSSFPCCASGGRELVEHFLATRQVGSVRYQIEPEALEALVHYDWPGNVRGLANALERAQIMAEDHVITLDDLPDNVVDALPTDGSTTGNPEHLREVERRHVLKVMQQVKGNKVHGARVLGISRRALYRLIAKYHIENHQQSRGAEIDQ
jgi:two-component system response regulator AtoC